MHHLTVDAVQSVLATHLPFYGRRAPVYQTIMLNELARVWRGPHQRVLDVGGGTGVIGEAIHQLLEVPKLVAIDIEDRFAPGLTIETRTYDGSSLPFADGSFDAATIMNVLHHIPVAVRPRLLSELRRVVSGPLYVKDHVRRHALDDLRLYTLDLIGNLPFGGMVWARYVDEAEWGRLARDSGSQIAEMCLATYRSGPMMVLFPNRLEITMRWEPI